MVPLYMVIGEKCNFCTYIVSGAPNGPPYMLTGKKCNFCTYIVSGAPYGPCIEADWGKVQFLHLLCYWCSLIVEIATFWPHFKIGPPNGPL